MATIADVARAAEVSIATVSRVLSPGTHPVNPETARRVREAAAALDFVPSAVASGLATRRTGLLGLVVRDLGDPHYPQLAAGAEEAARQSGLALLVCNTLSDSGRLADYLRVLRARRVDGLVVSGGSSLSESDLQALKSTGLPCVLIGRPLSSSLPFVAVDNRAAAADVARHLVQGGRRRLAHLGGLATQTTMLDRAEGFAQAAGEAGLEVTTVETDGTAESALRVTRQLLAQPKRPDALFAATDRLALAALAAALDAGIAVPGDLAIVGFDDTPTAALVRPALSSVAQPAAALGEAAIELIKALLLGEEGRSVTLPATLVPRSSSASA
jgi:LacI family transcriptional regulator